MENSLEKYSTRNLLRELLTFEGSFNDGNWPSRLNILIIRCVIDLMGGCPKFLNKKTQGGIMDDNKRQEDKSTKFFTSVKEILEFVDDFVAVNHKTTPEEEKAFAEIRQHLFEGIKRKRGNPESELFQTAKKLLDLFDRIESDPSSVTIYELKNLRTTLSIYEELLIGEQDKHSNANKLACFQNPVLCSEVAKIVHKRSDNIARRLRAGKYLVVIEGNKCYCDAEHAALIWPKWKKHWKKQKLEE